MIRTRPFQPAKSLLIVSTGTWKKWLLGIVFVAAVLAWALMLHGCASERTTRKPNGELNQDHPPFLVRVFPRAYSLLTYGP